MTTSLRIFLLMMMAGAAPAQSVIAPRSSATSSAGIFNKVKITFTATVEETMLLNNGKAVGSIITTSYVKTGGTPDRPVIFIFNGGPGSSSSLLHLGALGPRRLVFDSKKEGSVLVDNTRSVLDVADLVFIDPPGTGFTKILDSAGITKYWDVFEDAKMFTEVIKHWVSKNARPLAPLYLCGESYGGARVAAILHADSSLNYKGVVLLSPMLDAGATEAVDGNDMPYILFLPSLSSVAWYHKLIKPEVTSALEVYNQAVEYARSTYAPALLKGNLLSPDEKTAVAKSLAGITGLSETYLLEHNLRVDENQFVLELLASKGKRIGRLDGQITGAPDAPKVRPPWDDPSMKSGPPSHPTIEKYYTETLKFPNSTNAPYTTLNLFANSKWQWYEYKGLVGYWTVVPFLTDAVKANPKLNVMVCGGFYDLATPAFAAQYALEHSGVPLQNLRFYKFNSGHSIFVTDEGLEGLTGKIRELVRQP